MSIKLYNRQSVPVPPDSAIQWRVDRYSCHIFGGPQSATISAPVTVDKWDVFKMLRYGVEITNEDGQVVWW